MSSPEFLELLAREAAAVEFEGPLVAARAAGAAAGPARRAGAGQGRRRCGCARCWSAAGRREAELSGLFDTASDLAGLRDLDAVLRGDRAPGPARCSAPTSPT